MKILTLQQRLRIIIIIFFLIIVLIVGAVIYPNVRDIIELQQEIDATEEFLESQYQKTRRMQRTVQNLDAVVSSTGSFVTLTVMHGAELSLIEEFEQLALKHNIQQTLSVSYTETKDSAVGLSYYTFTFLNHGLLSDHMNYLDELLTQPFVVDIDSIEMQRRNNNTERNKNIALDETTLRFSAKIYAK